MQMWELMLRKEAMAYAKTVRLVWPEQSEWATLRRDRRLTQRGNEKNRGPLGNCKDLANIL